MNNQEELLHYLDILLRVSNFTKAAKLLYISQPYLTQLVKRIEKKLGTKIINRDSTPYTLTEAGLIYYHYLEKISYQKEELNRQMVRFQNSKQKLIKIGVLESLGTYLLGRLLPTFLRSHPNVQVQLFEDLPQNNEARLLGGVIDCFLGQTPDTLNRKLKIFANGRERYYVVIPQLSNLFKKNKFILSAKDYDLKELLEQPMVLSTAGSAVRHQVNGLYQRYHLQPRIAVESKSIITATNLAIHGTGLTISAASILKRLEKLPINLYPISSEQLNLIYFLAINPQRKMTKEIKEFINCFKNTNLNENIN